MYSTVRNSRSARGKLLVCLFAMLAALLSVSTVLASAEEKVDFTYVDYSVTVAVGDTVTLNGMKFESFNNGHYGEDVGYPSCYVSGDGYNAVGLSYEFDNVSTYGYGSDSMDHYSCDVSLTVTAIAPGTATAHFEYGTYYLNVGLDHRLYVPRITITVVESGPCSINAYPPCTENTSNNPYPTLPVPERPEWEFVGWYTQPQGGTQVTDVRYEEMHLLQNEDIDRMYAHWVPDYSISFNNSSRVYTISDGEEVVIDQAVIPYQTSVEGLSHNGFTFGCWINEYDRHAQEIGDEVWIMEELVNPGVEFVLSDHPGVSHGKCVWTDGERPQTACEAKLRLTCTWGGKTKSFDVTLRYQEVPLPTGTDIPDVIDLQVGQSIPLNYRFSDGYTFKDLYWYVGNIEWSNERFNDLIEMYVENSGADSYLRPRPGAAGYFSGTLWVNDENISLSKDVIFRIADEEGNLPEVCPFSSLPEGYVEAADYLMCPIAETTDSTEGWFSDAYLFGWGLDELDALRLAYGEDPSVDWSIEYVDGVRAGLTPEPYQVDGFAAGGCYIRVSELPKEAGTMRARLVCDWAGHTGYLPIEIHFTARPDELPENTMAPSRLTLPLGGSLTITSRFPDAEDEIYNGYAYLYLGNKTTVSVERVDAFSFRLTGLAPGTVSGMTGTGAYQNAFYHRGLTVTVDDTPIALPGNLKTIETEAFAGIDDQVFLMNDEVTEIQAGAFEPHVTIVCPEDSYAFRRCEELGLCVIGTSVE